MFPYDVLDNPKSYYTSSRNLCEPKCQTETCVSLTFGPVVNTGIVLPECLPCRSCTLVAFKMYSNLCDVLICQSSRISLHSESTKITGL